MIKNRQLNVDFNGTYNLLSFSKDVQRETLAFSYNIDDQSILNNFKWLEENLLDNQRIISALDFYKISETVNQSNIQTVFNNMVRNTSAIATEVCELNGEKYAVGDLVYKQTNGQPLPLKLGTGTYYPNFNTKGWTQALITWTYTEKTPKENNTEDPKLEYEQILTEEGHQSYSQVILSPFNADIKISHECIYDDNNNPILPVVKGYGIVNIATANHPESINNNEEIYWDFSLVLREENQKKYWHIIVFTDTSGELGFPKVLQKIVVK